MDHSERERHIAALLTRNDRKGQRELYDAYVGYLTGVCARYLSDDDDLKDVLQECFISIFRNATSFQSRGTGSLRAWLTRIAVNTSLKFLRDNSRFTLSPISESEEEIACQEADPDTTTLSQSEILMLIRKLPPGYPHSVGLCRAPRQSPQL